jgi:hypothetical protein
MAIEESVVGVTYVPTRPLSGYIEMFWDAPRCGVGRAGVRGQGTAPRGATWRARFRILERVLLAQLTSPAAPHPAVIFAVSSIHAMPHMQTIGRITERIGPSPRRFIEVFAADVGLTPKVFSRVLRFQRVLALIRRDREIEWGGRRGGRRLL